MAWDREDESSYRCFECGETGHAARHCPERRPPAPREQGPRRWDEVTWYPGLGVPVPRRKSPREIADSQDWAERIRQQMGWERGDVQALHNREVRRERRRGAA